MSVLMIVSISSMAVTAIMYSFGWNLILRIVFWPAAFRLNVTSDRYCVPLVVLYVKEADVDITCASSDGESVSIVAPVAGAECSKRCSRNVDQSALPLLEA